MSPRRRSVLPSPHLAAPAATPFAAEAPYACGSEDPEMFFDEERTGEALAVCARCPFAARCREYALDSEEFGVWGGTTPEDRVRMRGALAGTPEDRRVVWSIRQRIARGDLMPDVAASVGVNQRTLYRWLAEGASAPTAA